MIKAKYTVGDKVTYNNPMSEDHGAKGIIIFVSELSDPAQIKYQVRWMEDVDYTSSELEDSLSPTDQNFFSPVLSKESAEAIAVYLSLDSVESTIVQEWVKELRAYADQQDM